MTNIEPQTVASETPSLPAKQESPLISIIERLATNPEIDVGKIEQVFNLHMKLLEREAEVAFNRDMAFAQNEIQNVVVNRHNPHTNSAFADIAALHEAAKPIWTKCGFSVISYAQPIPNVDDEIEIICQVRHKDGHKVEFRDTWPIDSKSLSGKDVKTPMQGKGSTMSYARRYMELGIFDIAVSKYDKDGNKPDLAVKEQSDETKNKLQALKEKLAKEKEGEQAK